MHTTAKADSIKRACLFLLNSLYCHRRCVSLPQCGIQIVRAARSEPESAFVLTCYSVYPDGVVCISILVCWDPQKRYLSSPLTHLLILSTQACSWRWSIWLWGCWREMDACAYSRIYRRFTQMVIILDSRWSGSDLSFLALSLFCRLTRPTLIVRQMSMQRSRSGRILRVCRPCACKIICWTCFRISEEGAKIGSQERRGRLIVCTRENMSHFGFPISFFYSQYSSSLSCVYLMNRFLLRLNWSCDRRVCDLPSLASVI